MCTGYEYMCIVCSILCISNDDLPVPSLDHINERAVCNAIAPEKDVDGFHIVNIGKLCLDQRSMVPATPAAVWEIIKRAGRNVYASSPSHKAIPHQCLTFRFYFNFMATSNLIKSLHACWNSRSTNQYTGVVWLSYPFYPQDGTTQTRFEICH